MRHYNIRFGFICLLTLLWSANLAFAQDDNAISIVGTKIMREVLVTLGEAANIDTLSIDMAGTARGIDVFCNGDIDIAVASRTMSAAEGLICDANDVARSEFLFAHKILAFAAHDSVPLACIASSQLDDILKLSASNQATDWADYAPETDALPVLILAPSANSLEYAIADSQIAGDRLRNDVASYATAADGITSVGASEGALAILPFSPDLAKAETIKALAIKSGDDADCISPSAESVEAGLYPFAQSYFLYVNNTRLAANPSLEDFLQVMISPGAADTIAAFAFNPPSSESYDLNARMLSDPDSTFAVAAGAAAFEIPTALSGAVNISGSANAYQLLDRVSSSLSSSLTGDSAQLQININAVGQTAGVASLCAGEADIAVLDRPPQAADINACEESAVNTVNIDLGSHATILLGNATDEHSICLTVEQIDTIWNAASTDKIMAWQDIDASMPEQKLTLFGLVVVDRYADILLQGKQSTAPPIRRDTEQDFDALYRAAAVANVAGSLSYMSWQDYQSVLEQQQSNVQLVSVDDGSGCVSPSVDTILNGAYPLSRPASLLADEMALADINVQSLLWSIFADENWQLLEREAFVGSKRTDLPARRRQLEMLFQQAEAKAAASASTAETEADADANMQEADTTTEDSSESE